MVFKKVKKATLVDENGNQSKWNVYTKRYQKDAEEKGKVPPNYIDDCINSLGTSRLGDLSLDFSFSKPCELLKKLVKYTNKGKDVLVLDFFAGSGTSLDATMQLNAEDGGHRRCILATNNENGICENVTYERNRRVIQGYTTPKGEDVPGLTHNNLRYYKTKFVPRDKTTKNLRDLMTLSTDMLCIQAKMQNAEKDDSVTSVLKQLVRNRLFASEDQVNLVDECFIIKMNSFPKDGPIAKAIVYFIISKLNDLYEQLPKQAVNEEYVQIRHFTIIDEAHYMLGFNNRPLRNLIAVGRNKGLSIILATQNMESFKSKYFDYYANAQYPLIMKQQTIADGVVKDLFGVSGKEFQDIKSAIAGLQKGELIIKDNTMSELGLGGKKYKKMKVTRLI